MLSLPEPRLPELVRMKKVKKILLCREREPERPKEAEKRPISRDRDRERPREKERDAR